MDNSFFQLSDEFGALFRLSVYFIILFLLFLYLRRSHIDLVQKKILEFVLGLGAFFGIVFILDFRYISHQIMTLFVFIFFGVSLFSLIRNSFYGLVILIKKSIIVGDQIMIQDIRGVVHQISLTSTIIFTSENSYVHIPNSLFFKDIYRKESVHEEQHSAFIQFDLKFQTARITQILTQAKSAIATSIYVDVSEPFEVTVTQVKELEEQVMLHFKLHILNASFNDKVRSDLLVRLNKELRNFSFEVPN